MTKGPKYVPDFEFPADAGFSGSAGRVIVKGYSRGGPARKPADMPKSPSPRPRRKG